MKAGKPAFITVCLNQHGSSGFFFFFTGKTYCVFFRERYTSIATVTVGI